jgi:hypothetical protein
MYGTEMWSKTQFSPARSMDSKQQGSVVADKDGVANIALNITCHEQYTLRVQRQRRRPSRQRAGHIPMTLKILPLMNK